MSVRSPDDDLRSALQAALGPDFDVQDRLARGRTATVYSAGQRSLGRWVAVKVAHATSERGRNRFGRGAMVQARLDHPNILPVFHLERGGRFPYMVLPLERESVASVLLREGRFAPFDGARVLFDLSQALGAVHQVGVVHGDVKPQHVLLGGAERRALLTDFSGARLVSGAVSRAARGEPIGTPAYASPEVAEGHEPTPSSDLYSLGAMGYELLTGFVPFEGPAERQLQAHRTDAPYDPRERCADIPADLAAVVLRCLAKRPVSRWSGAAELAEALRETLRAMVARASGKRRWWRFGIS